MSDLKASPGMLMNVRVLVSLATMENPTDHQDICFPPRKYSRESFCLPAMRTPAAVTPASYTITMA
jgi:hypothetical protein